MGKWAGGMVPDVAYERDRLGHVDARLDRHRDALRYRLRLAAMNSGYYCNHEVDKLLDAGDPVTRDHWPAKDIYQKANRSSWTMPPSCRIIDDLQPILLSPKVKGFVNPPEDWFDLSTVSVE